ncbi:MAG: hypothetical protein MR260_05410 [Spirochaetia bacterium]|nr:hypothetical protein [Spirochaetia bacterium]
MKDFFKKSVIIFVLISSAVFYSCSFFNQVKSSTSLSVRLPEISSRNIEGGGIAENEFSRASEIGGIELNDDGKIPVDNISIFEITITSDSGTSISKSAAVSDESISFEDIEAGLWSIEFNAYALTVIGGDTKKITVAKTTEPVEALVKENETTTVEIPAKRIKYYTGDSDWTDISMNISVTKQLTLDESYKSSISELIKFEPDSNGIVEISSDGLIVPKKTGTTTINYSRLQDGGESGTITIKVYPVVEINFFVDGVNVSAKYPMYTKISPNNTDELNNTLSSFSLLSIMQGEGLENYYWFYDSACDFADSEKVTVDEYSACADLTSKYDELYASLNGGSTVEINLYAAKCEREVGAFEEFNIALTDEGSKNIVVTSLITLTESLTIETEKNITLTGRDSTCGINGNNQYRISMTGGTFNSLSLNNLKLINGYAGERCKGGMLNLNDFKVTVKNCNFTDNIVYNSKDAVGGDGGSLYLKSCAGVTIEDCSFTINQSEASWTAGACAGGLVYIADGCTSVLVKNSTFTGGYASHGGGLNLRVPSTVEGCTFTNNLANYRGGAINAGLGAGLDTCVITVKDCIFNSNHSSDIYANRVTVNAIGCKDADNNALSNSTCSAEDGGSINFE